MRRWPFLGPFSRQILKQQPCVNFYCCFVPFYYRSFLSFFSLSSFLFVPCLFYFILFFPYYLRTVFFSLLLFHHFFSLLCTFSLFSFFSFPLFLTLPFLPLSLSSIVYYPSLVIHCILFAIRYPLLFICCSPLFTIRYLSLIIYRSLSPAYYAPFSILRYPLSFFFPCLSLPLLFLHFRYPFFLHSFPLSLTPLSCLIWLSVSVFYFLPLSSHLFIL